MFPRWRFFLERATATHRIHLFPAIKLPNAAAYIQKKSRLHYLVMINLCYTRWRDEKRNQYAARAGRRKRTHGIVPPAVLGECVKTKGE